MLWRIPSVDANFVNVCRYIGVTSVKKIMVRDDIMSSVNQCHTNVEEYAVFNGGSRVEGSYVLQHKHLPIYQFIKHSVWDNEDELIDITPFIDDRQFNIFVDFAPKLNNKIVHALGIENKYIESQESVMFYVYVYIDPDTEQPMYVGKGTGDRFEFHLINTAKISNNRFRNKLNSLKKRGITPRIEFLAENITNEQIAYELEEDFIKEYGREGYDDGGILLNICESARPPKHKNKTYKEIYGDRWKEEVEKRRKTQIKRGGFGPKHHSEKTKGLLRKRNGGSNNGTYGLERTSEWRDKISKANKGKRRPNANTYIFEDCSVSAVTNIIGSTDAINFCTDNNISWSTLYKRTTSNLPGPVTKGKTKNWKLTIIKSKN